MDPIDLDHFRYVITTNTTYASQPPPNFRLMASAPFYELWERTGPTVVREVIEPPGAPGAILNCDSPSARALSGEQGEAAVMPAPVTVGGTASLPVSRRLFGSHSPGGRGRSPFSSLARTSSISPHKVDDGPCRRISGGRAHSSRSVWCAGWVPVPR